MAGNAPLTCSTLPRGIFDEHLPLSDVPALSDATHPAVGYDDFKRARRFPALDGLRAIAVMLVLTVHAGAHSDFVVWAKVIHGQMGVPIFFVLSGFLITTLLLREQESRGRVSLKAFYIRRVMRLAPLYYLVLCVYALLIFVPNLPEGLERKADMMRKLPLFVLYSSEYAAPGKFPVFGQAWSLGIEEKFYLAWPSLAFLLLSTNRRRLAAAVVLSVVFAAIAFAGVFELLFSQYYAELFVGCTVALALDDRRWFERLRFMGTRLGQTICFCLAILVQLLPILYFVRDTALYAVVAGMVIASSAVGEQSIWQRVLSSKVMTHIGQRSYAIYLIHVLMVHIVDRARIFQAFTPAAAFGAFAATLALSLVVAEGLYRCIEGPCIRLGHAWSSALQRPLPVPERAVG
jgi:peptidoglycan/LPS O-acetylase OafA/YrhL